MKLNKLGFIMASMAAMVSCASAKYISEGGVESISDAAIITPNADVVYFENSQTVLNRPEETLQLADHIIRAIAESGLPTTNIVNANVHDTDIEEALLTIPQTQAKNMRYTPLPPALDHILEANGLRYGVFSFSDGYLTSNQYFKKSIAESVLIGIVTGIFSLGTAVVTKEVEKHGFKIWIFVADSQTDKIVFYNYGDFNGWNPTDATKVSKAVNKLLKDF